MNLGIYHYYDNRVKVKLFLWDPSNIWHLSLFCVESITDDLTFNTKLNTNKYKFLFTNELEVVFIWNKHTAKIDCYGNSCMAILIFYTPVSRRAVLYDWVCQAGGSPHRFPHNNFSSVYRIFTKLGHMIPLWKGKNPIYFGVIRSKVKVTVTINIIFDNKVVSAR